MSTCPTCGQQLPFPHIPMSPMQHRIIQAIMRAQLGHRPYFRNFTDLGRSVGLNPALVRAQVQRMNEKLSTKRLQIINKPVKIVEVKLFSDPGYLPTQL